MSFINTSLPGGVDLLADSHPADHDQPPKAPALHKTITGIYLDYLDPKPEQIHPWDIAHQLAQCNRFNGACPEPYSVAEHCLAVSNLLQIRYGDATLALAGLLHDASEAYTGDLNGMLKKLGLLSGYREIEHGISTVIESRFGLPERSMERPVVKQADKDAFEFEKAFVRDSHVRRAPKLRTLRAEYYGRLCDLYREVTGDVLPL